MKARCPLSYAGKTLTHEAIKCGDHCAWFSKKKKKCIIFVYIEMRLGRGEIVGRSRKIEVNDVE